jgi:hypothetical protein
MYSDNSEIKADPMRNFDNFFNVQVFLMFQMCVQKLACSKAIETNYVDINKGIPQGAVFKVKAPLFLHYVPY